MKPKVESKEAGGMLPMPFAAFQQAAGSWAPMAAQALEGWQRGLNAGLRMMNVTLESAAKMRDAQFPNATDALARIAELQKAMIDARTPLELWAVQCNWLLENTERSMALCKGLYDAATEAGAKCFECVRDEMQSAGGRLAQEADQPSVGASSGNIATQDLVKSALVTFDAAYGQALKSSEQMMALAAEALSAASKRAATAAARSAPRRNAA